MLFLLKIIIIIIKTIQIILCLAARIHISGARFTSTSAILILISFQFQARIHPNNAFECLQCAFNISQQFQFMIVRESGDAGETGRMHA
jgi:hypothetical protein